VLAVAVPTAISDLRTAVRTAAVSKPIAACLLDQAQSVQLLGSPPAAGAPQHPENHAAGVGTPDGRTPGVAGLPAYAYPEDAARALGHAARYRAWRERRQGRIPELSGLRTPDARKLLAGFLAGCPAGGWLPAATAAELLSCYQIPLVVTLPGAVVGGVELVIGVVVEPVFGPLVVFGLGGTATEALGGQAARLAPLTDADADELIHAAHVAPLLSGHPGTRPVDTAALAEVLLRVSRLADDLPEVAELELSPVVAGPDGVCAVDGRVRVSPAEPWDPFLRRLR
jgi:acyl-CoA synthetase (NDP forming)